MKEVSGHELCLRIIILFLVMLIGGIFGNTGGRWVGDQPESGSVLK